jgi:hypothetical protein
MKLSQIRIQTLPSQWLITIKPWNWPLGFSISPWWVHWQQKHKVWRLNLRSHDNKSTRFWGQTARNRRYQFWDQTDENRPSDFEAQTTHKPSTLVLRFNQETRAPRLHVHDADRTQCHPTSRSPDHRVPDLCDHPRSSVPGLLLLSWSSSLHVMPHLPPAHHETSKHDSPNKTKIEEK